MTESDHDLWATLVSADKQLAGARAEFYQRAGDRRSVLAAALRGSAWDRGAALSFLEALPDDVPSLLDELVDNALSVRWALAARRAIAAGQPVVVTPLLTEIVRGRLAAADADDFRRLAELLRHLGAVEPLASLLSEARQSDDPETRQVADDFTTE